MAVSFGVSAEKQGLSSYENLLSLDDPFIAKMQEGGASAEGVREQSQWMDAILNDTEPLVKPEQAFVVTQILDAIYKSAETGKEVYL